jgi:TRAP-type mannitol/chloroaromatic compound transport system substrate-binding protein
MNKNIFIIMDIKIFNVFTTTDLSSYLTEYADNNDVKQILNINIENTNKNFLQLLEQIRLNEIDGFYSPINYASPNIFPEYINIFSNIPFELQFREYYNFLTNKFIEKNGLFYLNKILEEYNVICIPIGLLTPQSGGWSKTKIPSSNSPIILKNYLPFKNIKMRQFGTNIPVYEKAGAITIPLRGEDICKFANEGKISFAEFATPKSDYELGLYNCFNYYYITGCLEPCTTIYLFLNKEKVWNNLTFQQKDDLINLAYFNANDVNLRDSAEQPIYLELIKQKGIEILQFPEVATKSLYESWLKVKKDIANIDETGKEIIDYLNEFIEKYLLWTRISQRYQKYKFIK